MDRYRDHRRAARILVGLLLLLAMLPARAERAGFARYGAVAEVESEERGSLRQVKGRYAVENVDTAVTPRNPLFQRPPDEAPAIPDPGAFANPPKSVPLAVVPPPAAFFLRLAGALIALAALSRAVRWRRFQPPGALAELGLLLALAGCVAFYPEIARVSEAAENPTPPPPDAAVQAEPPPCRTTSSGASGFAARRPPATGWP